MGNRRGNTPKTLIRCPLFFMTQISISDLRPFHVVKNYDSIDRDKNNLEALRRHLNLFDYLVVGAGLFGSVFAYESAKRGKKVKVI